MLTMRRSRDVVSGLAALRVQRRSAHGRPRAACVALMALLIVVSGCASAGPVARNFWREDLGRMNIPTMDVALQKITQKHSLRLQQRQTLGGEARWEMDWIARAVVAEEELRGVTNARNRIVIRGVESGAANIDNYRMTWQLENEVTTETNANWHPDIVPASVIEEFRPIHTDLMLEVRTQIRN